jgi:uncharacterized protein (UPF0332 family)
MADQTWLGKADHYLEAAQILLVREHHDSAVSRAYYAARYAAIHLLLARKAGWNPKWQHETMATRLIEQTRNLLWLRAIILAGQTDFAKSWTKLLRSRSAADYDLDRIRARDAERCLAFAQVFVQAVKEHFG